MSNEDIQFYKELISKVLFPKRQFPRHIFTDLDQITLNILITRIREDKKLHYKVKKSSENEIIYYLQNHFTLYYILANHPNDFILIFRDYIRRFVEYKHFNKSEVDDVTQDIITRFLTDKIYRIKKSYRRELKKSQIRICFKFF